jgi:hypothetical protein
MTARILIIAVTSLAILLTGCQTMKPVDLATDQPITAILAPKDFIRVWTKDGRIIEMRLSAVETDALVSGEQRLPIKDIERIERRGFSATRTTLLVLGTGVVVVLGLAIYASHHVSVGFGR